MNTIKDFRSIALLKNFLNKKFLTEDLIAPLSELVIIENELNDAKQRLSSMPQEYMYEAIRESKARIIKIQNDFDLKLQKLEDYLEIVSV